MSWPEIQEVFNLEALDAKDMMYNSNADILKFRAVKPDRANKIRNDKGS